MEFNCINSSFNDIKDRLIVIQKCDNRNDPKWKRKGHPTTNVH